MVIAEDRENYLKSMHESWKEQSQARKDELALEAKKIRERPDNELSEEEQSSRISSFARQMSQMVCLFMNLPKKQIKQIILYIL